MVPNQKSMVSSAMRPSVNQPTMRVPTVTRKATRATLCTRRRFQNSSRKATEGCSMEMALVMAPMKSSTKNRVPKNWPPGMLANTCGSTLKPSPKVPHPAAATTPSSATAAGMIIMPATPTSMASLAALAVRELSAISLRRRT